jgi:hypothetical protein
MQHKLFCAACKSEYTQGGKKPECCGVCGSTWVAVKVEPDVDATFPDEGHSTDAATATGMYDHD